MGYSKKSFILSIVIILTLAGITLSLGFSLPKWFPFSTERSLDEWENKIFKGKVIYEIKQESLHALSESAASAIFYRIKDRFKAQDYPMISWKWRVTKFPDKEKLKLRRGLEKDDYAARVYIIFPSIIFFQSKALEYVWDEVMPTESVLISPYSSNIRLIVVKSGKDETGQWDIQERNILKDYQRAFGAKPNLKIGAIALMSDADSTGTISEAYFSDINIGYKKVR